MAGRAVALALEGEEEVQALDEAEAALRRTSAPLELARVLVDLADAHRRSGDRTAGREAANEAHDLADRIGATRLARHARRQLRLLGARPKPSAGEGLAALTPAERRVAD